MSCPLLLGCVRACFELHAHSGRPPQKRGKQPKLNRRQAHLVSLVHSGQYSTAEVAALFGVGRSTAYRAIERQRKEAKAGIAAPTTRR